MQMTVQEGECRLPDPSPSQVAVAGAGQLHVLHLDSGGSKGSYQAPRLFDRNYIVLGAVDHQKWSRASVDPG